MKKIILIICYFGNIPDYYKLWEVSALKNNTVDFLIYTDQNEIQQKGNIRVKHLNFSQLREKIQSKFNFKISLEKPYKLCDYKPAYGYIFDDEIKNYDFWGYCDMDLIFGNLRKFLSENVLENSNVILNLGHLTLYKNTQENKILFMKKGSIYPYTKVYSTKYNYAFDEMSGMHKIFKENNICPYLNIPIADIDRKYARFKLENMKNYDKQFFYYNNGIFRRYYTKEGKEREDEFCYLHFQKKHPTININESNYSMFTINKSGFCKFDKKMQNNYNYNQYISKKAENEEKRKYIFNKLLDFMKCNISQKVIWIKQKVSI